MVSYKFKVPFRIDLSHSIENLNFQESYEISEINPSMISLNIDGINLTVEIENSYSGIINIDCIPEDKVFEVLEKTKWIISFILEKENKNKHSGNSFMDILFFQANREQCNNIDMIHINGNTITVYDSIELNDKVSIKVQRKITLEEQYVFNDVNNFILENYYQALKAPMEKQKFINLFLILEYLESSEDYKNFISQKIQNGEIKFLFRKNELINMIQNYGNLQERQKSLISQLEENQRYTDWNRAKKLYEYLKYFLNENEIFLYNSNTLSLEDMRNIINTRNSIIHSGSQENSNLQSLLYYKLFPLCEKIINRIIND